MPDSSMLQDFRVHGFVCVPGVFSPDVRTPIHLYLAHTSPLSARGTLVLYILTHSRRRVFLRGGI
jgi:hypothetical protein